MRTVPLLALSGSALVLLGCARANVEPGPVAGSALEITRGRVPAIAASAIDNAKLPASVVDVTWQWIGLTSPFEELSIQAPARYLIHFGRSGRLIVRADCNRALTEYQAAPEGRLAVKPLALTRGVCPAGSLSSRFAKEVARATSYFVKDGDLFLELKSHSGLLRFRRVW
jgi:heat shock protein HslJ